jgi:uncharacterized protein YaaR (DUF327 family)
MKKSFLSKLGIVALFIFTASSCGKTVNCVSLISKVTTASSNYSNDPSIANCQAFKTALKDFINDSECSGSDPATKAAFQQDLDSLTACP